ncbi:MAG: hypothetical protein KJ069_02815 [Anaerolineae bacterium]|nr:hypothetical protein [Anaerolineae bacterium]
MPFPARHEYESLIYGVVGTYPEVTASTLRLYSTSALTAVVEGEVAFTNGLKLRVLEILDFKNGRIQNYSYAVYRGNDKIRWYDPQPHPENPALAGTFPHHYHEDPDIKHNRQPAKGVSFGIPNLPILIADCLDLGKKGAG